MVIVHYVMVVHSCHGFAFGVLGCYKLEALRALMGSLELFLFCFGLWLSYCVVVFVCFDAIIELHTMDGKMFNDFFIGN